MQAKQDRFEQEMEKPTMGSFNHSLSTVMNLITEAVKIRDARPSVMAAGQESEKRQLDKARSVLLKWLSIKDEVLLIRQAFNVLLTSVDSNSEANKAFTLLKRLNDDLGDLNPQDSYLYDRILDWLNISGETYSALHNFGCQLLKQNQIKEARVIFSLLTEIDQYQFEPWLFLGMSYELARDFFEAVCIFAMASLIDLKNPVPHLHSAGIYIQAGKQELAQQTLELCLKHITPEGKVEYRKMISDLKRQIYFQKWAHDLLSSEEVHHAKEFKATK